MRAASLLIFSLVIGCHDRPASNYPTQEVYAEDTTLGQRDEFEVRVFRHDEMSGTYAVSEQGTINFPEIGIVEVVGKTPEQVEREIQHRLADGFLVDPTVSVRVKEYKSKTISVFGQVRKPTTIPYVAGMSIADAISQAGGFTPMARKDAVKVTRSDIGARSAANKQKTVSFSVPVESIANGEARPFYMRPGDTIFVPERWY
jgi:polysaccharide export outer membrane protein